MASEERRTLHPILCSPGCADLLALGAMVLLESRDSGAEADDLSEFALHVLACFKQDGIPASGVDVESLLAKHSTS